MRPTSTHIGEHASGLTHIFINDPEYTSALGVVFRKVVKMDDVRGFVLEDKPVFDWNRFPLGTVADIRKDPRTRATRHVVVTLSPEAKTTLGTVEDLMEIPIAYVCGIRKDAVALDRSVEELRRSADQVAHVVGH